MPDGAYLVKLSDDTQEKLECVAGQDMHQYETLKFIGIEALKNDLSSKGNQSDFIALKDAIQVRKHLNENLNLSTKKLCICILEK